MKKAAKPSVAAVATAATAATDTLKRYKEKRNFTLTPEPADGGQRSAGHLRFVIQKHWATRLHYDFRLELDGSMKSWAVPKGPSFDPADKRMAMHVEDHPISYNDFEGEIPARQYGAGKVIIWDKGYWIPLGDDPARDYARGHMKFELRGHKLAGKWALVRMRGKDEKRDPWLLIKEKDQHAQPASAFSVVDERPDSVSALALPDEAPTRDTAPVKAALPDTLAPQLATLVDHAPAADASWAYELKYDGYRMLARIKGRSLKLVTRNGHDWTAQLPALAQALKQMKLPEGWYDGEIVATGADGLPDFQLLQQAFDGRDTSHLVYYLFDLPWCGGYDLREMPLAERRRMLASLLENAPPNIRFSDSFDVDPADILASACRMGLEGMIGKRLDSPYSNRRSQDWIKLKCAQRQEFVIVGYTDPAGTRHGFGSLLLAVHDERGNLKYAGNVGSGFDGKRLAQLHRKMQALHAPTPTVRLSTRASARKTHWIRPDLVAEFSFANWTRDGHIRHAVFRGLRSDKPAAAISREQPVQLMPDDAEENAPQQGSPLAGLRITHPERVIDAASGVTKIQVLRYYALVAPLMMPHLKDRPVSLVRAPSGVAGELFFQKHLEQAALPGVSSLPRSFDPQHPAYMMVTQPLGLLNAAQMNVLEFHTWNTTRSAPAKPDRFVLDLDPGEGVSWEQIKEATQLVHGFLGELGLQCLLKTSGGKGLHLVVPIRRQYTFEVVKDFSQALVQHLAGVLPQRFSAKSGARNRVGKIFLDYLRNGFGATTACAWSLRARPGLGVSVPIGWDELDPLHAANQWHIGNIHERLDVGNRPWEGLGFARQSLTAAMRELGYQSAGDEGAQDAG